MANDWSPSKSITYTMYGKGTQLEKDGKFEAAGDAYTEESHLALSHNSLSEPKDGLLGAALHDLLEAALCYRRAGNMDRCQNRCQQGVLIAEDFQSYVVDGTERRGLLSEFIGDFKTLGELTGGSEAYTDAIQAYVDADIAYTIEWDSNKLADINLEFFQHTLSRSDIKEPDDVELPYDFKGRVEYKREMLDTIISDLVDKDDG